MAAVIADSEGIDAVTLSRIALDAGVKQPALYRHVTGIEELWTLLSLRARDLLVTDLACMAWFRAATPRPVQRYRPRSICRRPRY